MDPLVQGLCAFVLGIAYETDRDASSPIPRLVDILWFHAGARYAEYHRLDLVRTALQPILHSRVGPDQFVNRILRLREDPRFRDVGPDVLELSEQMSTNESDDDSLSGGLWFDWSFVEFLKNNYREL